MLIHKKIICAALLSSLMTTHVVLAHHETSGTLVLNGFVGIANMQQDSATYNLTSDETHDLFYTDSQSWDAWTLQLGGGYQIPLAHGEQWFPVITPQINFYILNDADMSGEVYRFDDPGNDDSAYTMDFNSTRLMFDTALTIYKLRKISFYGIAGVGIAWSDLNLQLDPYPDSNLTPLNFSDETQTGLAYQFGGGISYWVNRELDVSLQYLYTVFTDLSISGQDGDFTLTNSDLDIRSQSILLGINLSV